MPTIWKPVVTTLTLVAGILGFSNSAFAGWQGTSWGMSVEEAARSFQIPHHVPTPPWDYLDRYRGGEMWGVLFDEYTASDLKFINGKLFKDGKEFSNNVRQRKRVV